MCSIVKRGICSFQSLCMCFTSCLFAVSLSCRKFSTTLPTQPVLSIGLSETVASFPSVSAPGLDWIDFSILDHSTLVCLRDSGEVQILRLNNPNGVELSDALPMFPSAQDNYTSDASVLLVLQTALPIVVIATPTGEMHHCIMLPKTEVCVCVRPQMHLPLCDAHMMAT